MSFSGDATIALAKSSHSFSVAETLGVEPVAARATYLRFLVLISGASMMFGNYYFFDQTSATQDAVRGRTGMSESTFGILSSVYSWPNVVLPLVGGIIVDRLGVRAAALAFTSLVLAGSACFTLGLWGNWIWLMIVGRLVFGLGGESQNVCNLTLISRWFAGRELAFAIGIGVTVSRLGSVAAFNTQPSLVGALNVVGASGVGTVVCFASLLAAALATSLDRLGERRDAARGLTNRLTNGASSEEVVRLNDTLNFGRMYWLVSVTCLLVYVAAWPFLQVTSVPYLQDRFNFDESHANFITSLPNLISAIVTPVVGWGVDKCGARPALIVLSAAVFAACNLTFLVYPECDRCWVVAGFYGVMGVALSLFGSVIWPCVPLVVEEHTIGTAYGVTTALQNLGMAISPILLTKLHDATGLYTLPFCYVILCCCFGICTGITIWIVDRRHDRRLSTP